ncbi:hypothetical protein ACRRQX_001099 [Yersinia enterocolitica]|nr:hypothetical protein [Yersinia enterocolitica]
MYHSAPEKLTGKPDGLPDWSHVCRSYGGNADFTQGYAAGISLGNLAAFPALDTMQQALPVVQLFY